MTFDERIRLIKRLDFLIKRRYKGNALDYAIKMGISRSAFFRLLDHIRNEFDSPIWYNKASGCYEYCKDGIIYFGFLPVEFLTEQALKKVRGGYEVKKENAINVKHFFSESQLVGLSAATFETRFSAEAEFNL
jgi:hypothetical protein